MRNGRLSEDGGQGLREDGCGRTGAGTAGRRGRGLRGEDDLACLGALDHRGEARWSLSQRDYPVDEGSGAGLLAEAEEAAKLVAGAHRRANDRELGEEDPGELRRRDIAAGGAGNDDPAARLERPDR